MNKYKEADTSFVINEDPSMKAIRISLPKPPPLHLIEGYGKDPEDQKFERIEFPFKLKRLEEIATERAKEEAIKHRLSLSQFRISKMYWSILRKEKEYYKEEIQFIKKLWWHRLHGYWFFNDGKPVFITGWHFMYLNFWYQPDIKPDGYPEYRDRDRKEFHFCYYAQHTTETFAELDEEGNAVKNADGTYHMIDTGSKVCFGLISPKFRRVGWTSRALCAGLEVTTRTLGTDGMGIMSYSDDNASSHFKNKMMPAWRKFPLFFKPYTLSNFQSNDLIFDLPKGEIMEDSLQTSITYATTADSTFFDGKKLIFCFPDEEGKTVSTDVANRWAVLKNCISLGNGKDIIGFSLHPSTVEEYTSGGKAYKELADTSNFYNRVKGVGQTKSGLFLEFINATEGLEGFVDEYGESMKQEAYDHCKNKLNSFLKEDTPEGNKNARNERKQFPLSIKDCWLGETGDIGWNIEIIDKAIQEAADLRGAEKPLKGNFEWLNNRKDSKVIFKPTPEGRWVVSNIFEGTANLKRQEQWFDPIDRTTKLIWKPQRGWRFTIGVDPYRPNTRTKNDSTTDSMSKGGIVVKWEKDPDLDTSYQRSKWQSDTIVCTYLHRSHNHEDFCEDVIKTAVWYGGMVYPEMNVPVVAEYFRSRGYYGYLKFWMDEDNKIKNDPGMYMNAQNKPTSFLYARDFIEMRGHTIKHLDLLEQLKNIPTVNDLNDYDLVAAFLVAMHGSKSKYGEAIRVEENSVESFNAMGVLQAFYGTNLTRR